MGTLVDASVLISVERGLLDLDKVVARHNQQQLCVSAITVSELLHGLYRPRTASQRHRRQAFIERVLSEIPVASFDLTAARVYAQIWAESARRGLNLGERDLMVAATALALGYSVATHDRRSFPKISGLSVELWS